MEHFDWGQSALGANTPEELERHGVSVYYAPNVKAGRKLVNLENGRITFFEGERGRPAEGLYADLESVARYCERAGARLEERDGLATVQGSIRPSPVATTVETLPNTGRPEVGRARDLRQYATAYEARQYLPELAQLLNDDELRQVRIYKAPRFERGQMYFDLDNPERGPFVATGDEGFIADHTYVCRAEVMEDVWAKLVTWRQQVDEDQERAIGIAASRNAPVEALMTGSVEEPPNRERPVARRV